jgi:hypothetical protein
VRCAGKIFAVLNERASADYGILEVNVVAVEMVVGRPHKQLVESLDCPRARYGVVRGSVPSARLPEVDRPLANRMNQLRDVGIIARLSSCRYRARALTMSWGGAGLQIKIVTSMQVPGSKRWAN